MSKKNCDLELTLVPSYLDRDDQHQEQEQQKPIRMLEEAKDQRTREMSVFYKGRVCVCDVTELQAREIIMLACTRTKDNPSSTMPNTFQNHNYHQQQLYNPMGLSMKRSLQRFLQKRKRRIVSNSPHVYNFNRVYAGLNN